MQPAKHGLTEFVRALKTFSSRKINELRKMQGPPVWQRNYYEHIIRNDDEYYNTVNYIKENPKKWESD
jgi:REP element-mobilizing transposase RayT